MNIWTNTFSRTSKHYVANPSNRIEDPYEGDVEDNPPNEDDGPPNVGKKRRYHFRQRRLLQLFEEESDRGIQKLFRMNREQIKILFDLIKDSLSPGDYF